MSTLRRNLLLVSAATILAVPLGAGPAAATDQSPRHSADSSVQQDRRSHRNPIVVPPTPYSFEEDFDPECTGLDIAGHFEVHGVDSTRYLRGTRGQAFLYKDTFRFTETWTDSASGDVIFTMKGSYVFEEVAGKKVPLSRVPDDLIPEEGLIGPVYKFTATETGWEILRDGSGQALYRTRGVQVFESLFDTLGDHAPGGTQLSFETVKVIGPHPLNDVDLCDVAAGLLDS